MILGPVAGRRNSRVQLAVTQLPPLEQAQQPPTVSARVARAAVDVAVGVDAVGAYVQLAPGVAGLHFGKQDAVFIGKLMGGVDGMNDIIAVFFGGHFILSFTVPGGKRCQSGILTQFSAKSKALSPFPCEMHKIKRGDP